MSSLISSPGQDLNNLSNQVSKLSKNKTIDLLIIKKKQLLKKLKIH